jgi:putative ABC transport system permease protein
VGAPLALGNLTLQIVGVLPAGFIFPSPFGANAEIVRVLPRRTLGATGAAFHPIVRLSPSVTQASAQAEIDALIAPLIKGRVANSTIVLDDVRSVLFPTGRPMMRYLVAAAGVILLAGCANIANLLLVRSLRRERDFGIRAALGAGGLRLARPLVIEGVFIGLAASAVALVLAQSTFDVLLRQVPPLVYRGASVGIDWRVAVAAVGLGLAAGTVLAILPAWRIWRYDVRALVDHVETTGRLIPRTGRPLLAIQSAAGVVLVFATVRATDALLQVLAVDLGISPANVVLATLRPPSDDLMQTRAFYARAIEALAAESNVSAVGASGSMPLGGAAPAEAVRAPDGTLVAGVVYVLGDYFEAVAIRKLRGSTEALSRGRTTWQLSATRPPPHCFPTAIRLVPSSTLPPEEG